MHQRYNLHAVSKADILFLIEKELYLKNINPQTDNASLYYSNNTIIFIVRLIRFIYSKGSGQVEKQEARRNPRDCIGRHHRGYI